MPIWNRTKSLSSPSTSASPSSPPTPRKEEPPTAKPPPTLTEDDYLRAAKDGNLGKVKECINNGMDKDAKDKYGCTALHKASGNGHLEIVQYLIETGHVDKEAKSNDGETALHYATRNGHLKIVQYLVETDRVDKEVRNNIGQSAYDIAMANSKREVVRYLQNLRSNPSNVTPQQPRVETSTSKPPAPTVKDFFNAAKEGNLDQVKYCVNNGIDKDAKDNDKWTTLHYATWKGHLEIVQYLIEICLVDMEARINDGCTALHIASRNDHLDIVSYLIETRDVNKEVRNNIGQTAYEIAIAKNKKGEVAQYLLKVSEDTSVNESTTLLENAALDQVRCATLFINSPSY